MAVETFILYRTPAGTVSAKYSSGSTQVKVCAGTIKHAYFLAGQKQIFDPKTGVGIVEYDEDAPAPTTARKNAGRDTNSNSDLAPLLERIANAVEDIAASLSVRSEAGGA